MDNKRTEHLRHWVKYAISSFLIVLIIIVLSFGQQDIPLDVLKEKYELSTSSYLSIQGMEVHYVDEGILSDTLPIVLIHGTGSSLHTFSPWADQLKRDHRVLRMDLPGYGLTGPFPDRDYRLSHYVSFIYDFLKAMNIKQCILGGNSLGGGIAWRFALAYPENVKKLILIDASGYPTHAQSRPLAFRVAEIPVLRNIFTYITPKSVARSSVQNVYADKTKVSDALVDRYFELTLRPGNRQAFVDRINTISDTTGYRSIRDIQQKTLILWGERDELIPVQNAYRFEKDLSNDTLVILEQIGHVPMEEAPEESLKVVDKFLSN